MAVEQAYATIKIERQDATARVILSRPEVHNAFNETMIAELARACRELADDASVRVVVLQAEGRSFSAGADIDWMERMAACSEEENRQDADRMADMLTLLNELPKPVVARVHGAALGGGAGLIAIADYVVALRGAKIGTTEVRVGLVPAVISPFVTAKIGWSWARAHFLMGDRFDADHAQRIGLVHEVVDDVAALDARVNAVIQELLAGSPAAQATCKQLLRTIAAEPTPEPRRAATVATIARTRASSEGREGLRAFMEKRRPSWNPAD